MEFKEHTGLNPSASSSVEEMFATPLNTPLSQQKDKFATVLSKEACWVRGGTSSFQNWRAGNITVT